MVGIEKLNIIYDEDTQICKAVCSYIKSNRIGSIACQECEYCIATNLKKDYILCGFKSKNKKMDNMIKVYIAGALFSIAEQTFNSALTIQLESRLPNLLIHLPQRECKALETSQEIYDNCINGIDDCDIVVAILEGCQIDDGTSVEIGYAVAKGKDVIGIRSDFRQKGDDFYSGLNCMISKSLYSLIAMDEMHEIVDELVDVLKDWQERKI